MFQSQDIFMHGCEEEDYNGGRGIAYELFSDSDSDNHTSENELSSHESDSDHDETQKDNTQY